MDGENIGKPYEQMDDLGVFPLFLETPIPWIHTVDVSEIPFPNNKTINSIR